MDQQTTRSLMLNLRSWLMAAIQTLTQRPHVRACQQMKLRACSGKGSRDMEPTTNHAYDEIFGKSTPRTPQMLPCVCSIDQRECQRC